MSDQEEMSWQKSPPEEEKKHQPSSPKQGRSFEEVNKEYGSPAPIDIGMWLAIGGMAALLLLAYFDENISDENTHLLSQVIFLVVAVGVFITTIVRFRRGEAMFDTLRVKRKKNPKMFWIGFVTSILISIATLWIVWLSAG